MSDVVPEVASTGGISIQLFVVFFAVVLVVVVVGLVRRNRR